MAELPSHTYHKGCGGDHYQCRPPGNPIREGMPTLEFTAASSSARPAEEGMRLLPHPAQQQEPMLMRGRTDNQERFSADATPSRWWIDSEELT